MDDPGQRGHLCLITDLQLNKGPVGRHKETFEIKLKLRESADPFGSSPVLLGGRWGFGEAIRIDLLEDEYIKFNSI